MPSDFIGMIGIGAMGRPIAQHIAQCHPLCFYSRHEDVREEMRKRGALPVQSVSDFSKLSSLIFLCVKDYEQCKQVMEELFASGFCGTVALLSTIGVDEAHKLNLLCSEAECSLLALPISGGVKGAESGDLTGYYSGCSPLRQKAISIAQCFCKKIYDLGNDVGVPYAIKAIIQFLVAANIVATSEAASMVNRLGLDRKISYEAICDSSGSSSIFLNRGREAMSHDFDTGKSGIGIHLKDLRICSELFGDDASDFSLLGLCLELFSRSEKMFDNRLDATVMTLLSDGNHM